MKIRHGMSVLVMIKDSSGQRVMGIHPQQKPAKTPRPPLSWHDIPGLSSRGDLSCQASLEAAQGVQCAPIPAHLALCPSCPRCGGSCPGPSCPLPHPYLLCSGLILLLVSGQPVPAARHFSVSIVMSSGHCHLSLIKEQMPGKLMPW